MNDRKIKRLARNGRYLTNVEYWIKIDEINLPDKKEGFSERRMKRERNYLSATGLYATRILIDRNFNLVDGYISVLLALENGEDTVPINFVCLRSEPKDEDFKE